MAESILQYVLRERNHINKNEIQSQKKAKILPHRHAPGSLALQVDDGAASMPFLSRLRGQKLLALKVSQQRQ